jgi:hypothetical protein
VGCVLPLLINLLDGWRGWFGGADVDRIPQTNRPRLLDILAMRVRQSRSTIVGGAVLVNGRPRHARQFLSVSAYVPQVKL